MEARFRLSLGMFSYFGYRLPLQQRLEMIRKCGIDNTSIWWGSIEELVAAGRQHEIPGMVRDLGLTIQNMHAPYEDCNQLWSDSPAERANFLCRHLAFLDDCIRHDITCMVLHVSHGPDGPGPTTAGLSIFEKLVDAAEDRRITLAVENTRRDDINHFLFENIDNPTLAFCYDSSHDRLWGKPYMGTLERWGHRLVQTHFADCDGDIDRHMLPRDGIINWPRLAQVFPADYRGCLMLEVMPNGIEDRLEPSEFLQVAMSRLHWLAELLPNRQ